MTQWQIKQISDLTGVSVRMLRYYDKIGLLKPSVRASNGYRLYSEQNLAELQQIIALKFFGFSLSQIKTMLQQKLGIRENLLVQQQILWQQAEHIQQAQDAIATVLERCTASKSLDWQNLVTLIERYHMAEEIKKTWAGKLNEDQKKCYVAFRQEHPKAFRDWEKAVDHVNSKQPGNPEGPEGERIAKAFIEFQKVNAILDSKKEYKPQSHDDISKMAKEIHDKKIMNPKGSIWFAKAMVAYRLKLWEQLYQDIEKSVDSDPQGPIGKKLAQKWRDRIDEELINSPDFTIGQMLWQGTMRDQTALQEPGTPSEEKNIYTQNRLVKNLGALSWIVQALQTN